MEPLSEKQKATNWETLCHIELVMQLLAGMQHEISRRMFSHDRSKLISPEMEMFEQFTANLAGLTYGSPEYEQCRQEMFKIALGHHYENNRHHPEFFLDAPKDLEAIQHCDSTIFGLNVLGSALGSAHPDDLLVIQEAIKIISTHRKGLNSNVNGMNLIDVLEMVCDWVAACKRHNDGDPWKSLEINADRFGLSPQLVSIIANTLRLIETNPNPYGGLISQKDLQP